MRVRSGGTPAIARPHGGQSPNRLAPRRCLVAGQGLRRPNQNFRTRRYQRQRPTPFALPSFALHPSFSNPKFYSRPHINMAESKGDGLAGMAHSEAHYFNRFVMNQA